ncbi:PIN domain-containing protein [Micromonospora purpureochromogenes]|uniref:PIN-like domain-containing protein n=1 Tax=Micromonospora purpureochromogenes TaxID=47872 RepID=UPI0033CD1B10
MTKGFSDGFTHFLAPSDDTIRKALTDGMVVLDTNVLLSAYRFASRAREELFLALERLRERLWIPHQVGLEFHRNRLEVMADRMTTYDSVLNSISTHKSTVGTDLENKIRFLSNRAALTDAERDKLLGELSRLFEPLEQSVQRLSADHAQSDNEHEDAVLARLQRIVGERIGDEFDEATKEEAGKEAARRIKEQIPPGFKDADKPSKHGDYFVWRQILNEAKQRTPGYLVFVTGDQKEDWYLKVKGKNVGARPELVEEAKRVCDVQLVMMNTQSLLHHAKKHLNANVSAETIRQAGEIPTSNSSLEERFSLRVKRRFLQDQQGFHAREASHLRASISSLQARLRELTAEPEEALSPPEANRVSYERLKIESEIGKLSSQLMQVDAELTQTSERLDAIQNAIREMDRRDNG